MTLAQSTKQPQLGPTRTRARVSLPSRSAIAGAVLVAIFGTFSVSRGQTEAIDAPTANKPIAAILPLTDEITDVTVESLRRRVDLAREAGAEVIIFELNTPGGLVTSSIAIADLIKNLPDIKTVAWVNPNAHSGGTIVAVACDEIVMARSSRMGDSQVIMGGPGGAAAVPEELQPKAYTPVLSEFRASCRLNGYDQTLCESFVLPDREVWWVEHTETHERRFVNRSEKMKLLGDTESTSTKADKIPDDQTQTKDDKEDGDAKPASPETPIAVATSANDTKWQLVAKYHDTILNMDVDTIQPIVPSDQLFEMSAAEAAAYGFSKGIVANETELRERYGASALQRFTRTWSEALAFWMTSIYVRGFLMVIIMLGAYVEFHTPGVGVPGMVALICLGIFVGAPYLTGLANVWEIFCIAIGMGLIGLEVFVIPGFGAAGISGLALVVVGLLATFVPEEPGRWFPLYFPQLPDTVLYLKRALATLVSATTTSVVGMVVMSRYLPQMPFFNRVIPANPTPSEVRVDDPYRGLARVGDIGKAVGPLHPAGRAMFASLVVDVVTRGEFLETDAKLEIIERRGNRVVVRAVT